MRPDSIWWYLMYANCVIFCLLDGAGGRSLSGLPGLKRLTWTILWTLSNHGTRTQNVLSLSKTGSDALMHWCRADCSFIVNLIIWVRTLNAQRSALICRSVVKEDTSLDDKDGQDDGDGDRDEFIDPVCPEGLMDLIDELGFQDFFGDPDQFDSEHKKGSSSKKKQGMWMSMVPSTKSSSRLL